MYVRLRGKHTQLMDKQHLLSMGNNLYSKHLILTLESKRIRGHFTLPFFPGYYCLLYKAQISNVISEPLHRFTAFFLPRTTDHYS